MASRNGCSSHHRLSPCPLLLLLPLLLLVIVVLERSSAELISGNAFKGKTDENGYPAGSLLPVRLDKPLLEPLKHRRQLDSSAAPNRTGCTDNKGVPCAWWKPQGYCSPYRYFQAEDKRVRDYWCPQSCGICGATWPAGQALSQGQGLLVSPEGAYRLDLRADGNLVVSNISSRGEAIWSLQRESAWPTAARGPYQLMVKPSSGILEVTGAGGAVVWSPRLGSVDPGPYTLILQDSGYLEVVAGSSVVTGKLVWSSACPVIPEGYTFIPRKDHAGGVISPRIANVSTAAALCLNDCRCQSFSSAGFLKSSAEANAKFTCNSCCSGLYVRDSQTVCAKATPPSPRPPSPLQPLQQPKGSRRPPPQSSPTSPRINGPSPSPPRSLPRSPNPPPSPRPRPPPPPRPRPPPIKLPPRLPPPSPRPPPFAEGCMDPEDALRLHNTYRKKHGSANLIWDTTLASHAQAWAARLASTGCTLFFHSNFSEGENLQGSGHFGTAGMNCSSAVEAWYEAASLYNFTGQPFTDNKSKGGMGGFTQLVWASTTKVGCGAAMGDGCYVVSCRYTPPGNVAGDTNYLYNVLSPSLLGRP